MRIKNPLDNIKYPLFNRSHSNAKKKRASSEQNLEHDFPSQSEATVNGSVPEIRNHSETGNDRLASSTSLWNGTETETVSSSAQQLAVETIVEEILHPFEDQMHGKVQEEIEKQKQVIRTLVSAYEQRASKAEMETKSLKATVRRLEAELENARKNYTNSNDHVKSLQSSREKLEQQMKNERNTTEITIMQLKNEVQETERKLQAYRDWKMKSPDD